MKTKEREIVKNASASASQTAEDNDQEMHECLAKLKVWRVENLMSPGGMDRFAQDIRSKGTENGAEKTKEVQKNSCKTPARAGRTNWAYRTNGPSRTKG
ncbi:MAG: hypothetical protein ACHQ0Y_11470 [Thermodesulfovibrionales bacterium]